MLQQTLTLENQKFRKEKLANAAICFLIFILGFTATAYKAVYEGNLWTCFREMTVCGTVFSSLLALYQAFLSLHERKTGRTCTAKWLFSLRLSSCTTEFIILVIVIIGYLPFIPEDPVILRYDMMNMHVLIPVFTIFSFLINDRPPAGPLTFRDRLDSLAFLALYTVGQLFCILLRLYPEEDIPYFFLDVRNQPLWFSCFAFAVIYGLGYATSCMFISMNRKIRQIPREAKK